MFQYRLDVIGVHSHSWSTYYDAQIPPYLNSPSVVEQNALSNAFSLGRGGRGLVMVQSAGNYRAYDADANDDGYVSDPRKIAVGAVRADGRAASYSTPGACVLVAAPSGELDNSWPAIFTTDRRGSAGYNASSQTIGGPDYVQDSTLYTGTSASTPQIAGLAALLVSANTNLTYRDVQQIFVLSSRIWDRADNTLQTNGAGLEVSHRVGFGAHLAEPASIGHLSLYKLCHADDPRGKRLSRSQRKQPAASSCEFAMPSCSAWAAGGQTNCEPSVG
jgi:subtilisin family serine protease